MSADDDEFRRVVEGATFGTNPHMVWPGVVCFLGILILLGWVAWLLLT